MAPSPKLLSAAGEVSVAGARRSITRRAGHERRLILAIEGCETRDAAVRLRGAELLVDRREAPELEQDEWWPEDLEGCSVHDGGVAIGVVRRLVALPSCEALDVQRTDGGELLVPLVSAAVRSVDVERKRIEVDLGFLAPES